MGIEVTTPGSKVGCKLGNPTNIESRSETESTTSDTSTEQTTGRYQTSNYIIIIFKRIVINIIVYKVYFIFSCYTC